MELILWRHAEAEDGPPDDERELTARGRKQAERMARWLADRLPEDAKVLASPTARTRQTADALGRGYRTDARLQPGTDTAACLAAIGWPKGARAAGSNVVVVVGHQPTLGRLASLVLSGQEMDWSVKKGAVWWFSTRDRDASPDVVLRAVVAPDLL